MSVLADAYRAADPFPHIMIDGMFDSGRLHEAAAEIENAYITPEASFYGSAGKRRTSDPFKLGPITNSLIEEMNSPAFVAWLESLTGIVGLHPDPFLEGGGVHQIGPGGFLKIHTDFNWHKRLQMHRRVNVLLYLNEGWKEEWGGSLELWSSDMRERRKSYAPLLNRLLVFSTTDDSYHGHPDPIRCPENVRRNSIALYYYSVDRPACESRFGASSMTNYRRRPDDHLGMKHRVHQTMLRLPILRSLLGK